LTKRELRKSEKKKRRAKMREVLLRGEVPVDEEIDNAPTSDEDEGAYGKEANGSGRDGNSNSTKRRINEEYSDDDDNDDDLAEADKAMFRPEEKRRRVVEDNDEEDEDMDDI
jgi:hypothetical protein